MHKLIAPFLTLPSANWGLASYTMSHLKGPPDLQTVTKQSTTYMRNKTCVLPTVNNHNVQVAPMWLSSYSKQCSKQYNLQYSNGKKKSKMLMFQTCAITVSTSNAKTHTHTRQVTSEMVIYYSSQLQSQNLHDMCIIAKPLEIRNYWWLWTSRIYVLLSIRMTDDSRFVF